MKPAPFAYHRPESLDEALDLLGRYGDEAKILAGGQSLIPVMNFRLAMPSRLIDVNRLGELDFVEPTANGGLRIGALVRHRRLEREPLVAQHQPLLAEAIPWVAHPQIRTRGTFGGTLAHADPAAELPAVATALDARITVRSQRGTRQLGMDDFLSGLFTTCLEPDELVTEVELPAMAQRTGWSFLEVARRHGDYAQVGIAALVTLVEDRSGEETPAGGATVADARLVFLSVGDRPIVARSAAGALAGRQLDEETIRAAAAEAQAEIEPRDDIHSSAAFKRHLAAVLTRRALVRAGERATGRV